MFAKHTTILTGVALGLVVAASGPSTATAQPPPRREDLRPFTVAKDAKDLRAVLYNWTSYMGMLRGPEEHEMIATLEYQGTGTIQVNGQPCKLTKYRTSTNYQTVGQRIQYSCTRANGQAYSNVEVVSGQYAWDEDIPGAELIPGKGKAKPMPNALQERLIRLWAGPQGAPKAAIAATTDQPILSPNPGLLVPGGVDKAGKTSVVWEGGKPVITFPIPGVEGATATATLNDKYMAERVIVKHGSTTTEFTYGDYNDFNNPLNKVEAYFAGKTTERRGTATLRDLTAVETETGTVYVTVPVPASVQKAIKPKGPAFAWVIPPPEPQAGPTQPTPRTADGKPSLAGNWETLPSPFGRYGNRQCGPSQLEGCSPQWNQNIDYEFYSPSRFGPSHPVYKPEHWDEIQRLDQWTNKEDPVMTCQPLGVPRHGPPRRIDQTANDVTFFYTRYADGGGGNGEYRIIPTKEGLKHDPQRALTTTYMGYALGRWEGETLVIDSISFNDATWLGRGGFKHSDGMHVVERLTRKGNELLYEVTVEDPDMFLEPWVMAPRTLRLSSNPEAGFLPERDHCEVYEADDIATQLRH